VRNPPVKAYSSVTGLSSETLHASCVAIAGRAVLIEGPSGSGKSDLALRLIDRGATLVSDDSTVMQRIESLDCECARDDRGQDRSSWPRYTDFASCRPGSGGNDRDNR
jgi:ABC-type lipoprotein export system ATPase subunit